MTNIEMDVVQNNNEIEFDVNQTQNLEFDINTPTGTMNYNKLANKPKINGVELTGNKSLSDLGIDQDFVKDDNYVHTDNNFTNADKTKLASLHNYDDTEIKADIQDLERTKADKTEIEDFITKDVDNLTYYTKTTGLSRVALSGSYNDLSNKPDLSNFATKTELSNEETTRENADIGLQSQIDAITSSSDVKDIVGTYQELQNYDTSTLGNDDIIKVLQDNTHNEAMTYYRWVISGSSGSWQYIGQEGPYYTKSESDSLLNAKQNTIDSTHKLDSDLVDDTNQTNKFVTDAEKQTWNNKVDSSTLTDYVKFTDYGNNTDTTGVSRGGNYGWRISGAGAGYVQKASDSQVIAKENAYCPIVPSSLDLAVKTSITTNEISLTDEEKETAQNWLGIDEIIASATGNNIKLTDSRANKIPSLNIYGKSTQDVNTGSNLTYMTSSNYVVKNAYAKFGTNVIVEDNGSALYFPTGSVLSSANTRFLVYLLPTTADKWYTFQVEADPETSDIGVTFADYQPNPTSTSDRISALAAGKNISYTFQAQGDRVYCIEFRSPTNSEGVVTNNPTKVKVMFNEGGPQDWEPYTNGVATPTMTTPSPISSLTSETLTITDGVNTQTATLNLTTDGIPVSSGGNYTDEEGQQYIADSIERYEDGTGKLIKRTYRQTLPNSFTKSGSSGNFLLAVSNLDYAPKLPSTQYVISYDIMCNQFTNDETWISQNGYVVVDGTKVSFADATEFNTYFAEHPLIYEYVLDTPIETNLTAEQLEQLDLATYNGETTITSNTGVEVEYIANAKKYVDNKIETGLMNRDKYVLLAENTITEPSNTAVEWNSTGEDDIYDDIIVSCENMLGSAAGTGAVAYRLSNSNDNFTVSQSNLLSSSTVRTYWADCIRYLPNKWKFEKRGATNAVGDVTGNAIRVDTQWEDKINRVRFYAGSSINFVQGTYRIYGRKRF